MLNQRLQACAAWIADGKTVCDVGTDHAYLAAELLRKERCQHVIASDIGEGPVNCICSAAIERISCQWMPNVCHMYPNLMGSPCFQP